MALHWYERAASSGDPACQAQYGVVLQHLDDPDLFRKGMLWTRKAAAAGDVASQYALGALYAVGDVVRRNPAEARIWYRRAAKAGNAEATYNLGVMYWEGDGGPMSRRMAHKLWHEAATKGEILALLLLASAYRTGTWGFEKDPKRARSLQRKLDRIYKKIDEEVPLELRRQCT